MLVEHHVYAEQGDTWVNNCHFFWVQEVREVAAGWNLGPRRQSNCIRKWADMEGVPVGAQLHVNEAGHPRAQTVHQAKEDRKVSDIFDVRDYAR